MSEKGAIIAIHCCLVGPDSVGAGNLDQVRVLSYRLGQNVRNGYLVNSIVEVTPWREYVVRGGFGNNQNELVLIKNWPSIIVERNQS